MKTNKDLNDKNSQNQVENNGFAFGLCIGLLFGLIFHNITLGLCLGVCFGLLYKNKNTKKGEADDKN